MSIKIQVDVQNTEFKIEKTVPGAKITGKEATAALIVLGVHESLLQECEKDIIWYRDNFFGKPHVNFLAMESPKGPLAVSIIKDDSHYKVLARSTQGSERLVVQSSAVPRPFYRRLFGLGPSYKDVMAASSSSLPVEYLKQCKDTSLPNELLAMEERQVIRSYKFGVLYLNHQESNEEASLQHSFEETSPAFKQFLDFLGERIELKGWKGYKAGLDVSTNQTGTHSYYTKWQGYEIMFHIASLLPFQEQNRQQLERKRHIGNDIVVILFSESDAPFQFSTVTSKQNHIFAFVKPMGDGYGISIVSKTGVPNFIPEIPEPSYIEKNAVSRDFLLYKLINGERASYKSPSFAPKISRTRSVLLYDVAERFLQK